MTVTLACAAFVVTSGPFAYAISKPCPAVDGDASNALAANLTNAAPGAPVKPSPPIPRRCCSAGPPGRSRTEPFGWHRSVFVAVAVAAAHL